MTDEHPQFGYADEARRYRLESRIATGGMGEVWRATDTVLGRTVAVKLLKTEYADNASFRSRFETEARHAASLHHPGVAAVYDFGEASSADGSGVHRPFLVMELVDGQPLSALLLPGQPLDPDVTRDLLAQAGDAIGAAHAAGIVHRDVKPANLLVTPDRRVKITDFGIARAAEGIALTETGQVMGTPQYLSPEQAEGKTATPASDVYSLGVVAFECLAGRRPFVAETAIATALMHLREPVPDLPSDVPADLAAVVRRSLAKSPAERFPDATAFAAALRDPATASTAVVAPTAGATQVLGGAAAAGLAGAGAAAAASTPAPAPATGPVAPIGPATGAGTGPDGDGPGGGGPQPGTIGSGPWRGPPVSVLRMPPPGLPGRKPRTTFKIGPPEVPEGIDKNMIRRYVQQKRAQISYCYERELTVSPSLTGTANTAFTIDQNGRVIEARASGLGSSPVERCLEEVLRSIQFPRGEIIHVTSYPFTFHPVGG